MKPTGLTRLSPRQVPDAGPVPSPAPGQGAVPAPFNVWTAAGQLLALQRQMPRLEHLEERLAPPLSFAQERLWTLEQSEPGAAYYHVPMAWEIEGQLNTEALEQSLNFLVQRHQALRTIFPDTATGPVQQVIDWQLKLQVVELPQSGVGNRNPRQEALSQGREFCQRPFNVQTGPLLRATLFHWAPQQHLLVVVVHQMVFDGGSMRIFARELTQIYRDFSQGTTPSWPPETLTYGDFAHWQRKCLQGELLEQAVQFWRGQFQQPYEPLRFPADRSRQNGGITPGAQVPLLLPRLEVDALKKLAHHHGVTSFAALLGSFQAFLGQWTGQEDVMTLVSIAARNQPELRNLVGLIANVVPMRLGLSGNPSFAQVLARAGHMTSAALAHQQLPLSRILELLRLPDSRVTTPALQVVMLYSNAPLPAFQGPNVTFTPTTEVDNGTARFDLMLDVADSPQGIVGQLKYRSDVFERGSMEQLLSQWRWFVQQAVAQPNQLLGKVSVASATPALALTTPPLRSPSHEARTAANLTASANADAGLSAAARPAATVSASSQPRTPLEQRLTRIWENVFELQPIGIHDNFFGLGGHSLVGVKLIAAIEKATGRKLRLSTIFYEPTIERLAAAMERNSTEVDASSIVEIQPRGSQPPLFLVHGVGGGMFWGYRNLAQHLGPDQPLYAFKSRGIDGLPEFTCIEDMAAQYVADLRKFYPRGPYNLGGYCFGGNVAYEMARQLTEQGQPVGLLVLMNSWPNNSSYARLSWTPAFLAKALWNFLRRLQHQISWAARQPRAFLEWRTAWARKRLRALFSGKIHNRVEVEDFLNPSPRTEQERQLWRTHVQAWLQYQPPAYPGPLVLLRTRGHPLLCSFEQQMGWGSFAKGGVVVKICPGDHESILEQENVAHAARELKAVLQEAACHRTACLPRPQGLPDCGILGHAAASAPLANSSRRIQ